MTMDAVALSVDTVTTGTKLTNVAYWTSDYDFRHGKKLIASFADGHIAITGKLRGAFDDRLKPLFNENFESGTGYTNGTNVVDGTNRCLSISATAAEKTVGFTNATLLNRILGIWALPVGSDPVEFAVSFKVKRVAASTPQNGYPQVYFWTSYRKNQPLGWVNGGECMPIKQIETDPLYTTTRTTGQYATIDKSFYASMQFKIVPCNIYESDPNSRAFSVNFDVKNYGSVDAETAYVDEMVIAEVLPG
jgi:prepilin-type processing-associated H-X9-DG protein